MNVELHHVIGRDLDDIIGDFRGFLRTLTVDRQLRWLGPEKGILHMATGAVVNAVWDLWAKREGKPLWKLLSDLTPEQIVSTIDFSYITDTMRWPRDSRARAGYYSAIYVYGSGLCTDSASSPN